MKFKLTLILTSAIFLSSFAQKVTEGIVEYKVSYPNSSEKINVAEMMLPETMELRFKNDLTRADMPTSFISTKTITNSSLKSIVILMDVHNHKIALPVNQQNNHSNTTLTVKETGRKQMISEINCKEAWLYFETLVIPHQDTSYISIDSTKIFYTTDIGNQGVNWNTRFKGLDGFLMEYELKQNGITMLFSASKVSPQKIPNADFLVPEEYQIMTQEELEETLQKVMTEIQK